MEDKIVQGLWVGNELSVMERLSIASFLSHGHEYHLYVYGEVGNIPNGTTVRDARDILPESLIFQYKTHKSFSAFANFFRYKLLLERGGWWVDADTICLKPFDFPREYVFSSERYGTHEYVNCGVIKVPPGSAVMSHAWGACCSKNREDLKWGEVGPRLIAESVEQQSLHRFVESPHVFCPIAYPDWHAALDPARNWHFTDDVYAVHLWNEMWRRDHRDKDQVFHRDCLYEQLKRRYLA